MAYESLKQEIQNNIKTNGEGAITGQILQDTLLDMVTTIGKGYTLFTDTIQDRDNLPAVPTDGGKYFLFADYVSGARKYRYIYFSTPGVNNGAWYSGGTLFRINIGQGESSAAGNTPITMSYSAIEGMITDRNRTTFLEYGQLGNGTTWDEFVANTAPRSQEAEDQQTIEHIGNFGDGNVALSVGGQGAKYYYLTGLIQNGPDDFELHFGASGDGYVFQYSSSYFDLDQW